MWIRAVTLSLLAGCATPNVGITLLASPPRDMQRRPAEAVEVFDGALPRRAFLAVALLEANSASGWGSDSDFVSTMRDRAAALGCEAIVVGSIVLDRSKRATATCILYRVATP